MAVSLVMHVFMLDDCTHNGGIENSGQSEEIMALNI